MCLMNIDHQHDDLAIKLGSQDRLICFEPVSVDCCNVITCFDCIFVNTIVEVNLTAFTGSLWSRDSLRRSGVRFS